MKMLIVNPTASYWRVDNAKTPPGNTRLFRFSMHTSLAVAASAPPGTQVKIIDEEIEAINYDIDADLIGISFMTFNAPRAYDLADKFKRENKKTVIAGGYHPSFLPDEALLHFDSVCIGEAEANLNYMINDFQKGKLKKIYNHKLNSLKGLKIPDRSLLNHKHYAGVDTIQATRGCPNKCSYCSITSFFNHIFRSRPIDEVIYEMQTLGSYILFLDDNIISDEDYANELFARMIPLNKKWFSQCSINIAYNEKLLDLACRSGCRGLFIGFESINQGNLDDWGKDFGRSSEYSKAIKKLHSKGMVICAAIVFGNDSDSENIFVETLEFLYENKIDVLQATILTPFPGTPLFAKMEQQGRIIDYEWSNYDFRHVVFEPKNMSREKLVVGHNDTLKKFYSWKSISRRFFQELMYVNLSIILRSSAPLNISYRSRLKKDKTFN